MRGGQTTPTLRALPVLLPLLQVGGLSLRLALVVAQVRIVVGLLALPARVIDGEGHCRRVVGVSAAPSLASINRPSPLGDFPWQVAPAAARETPRGTVVRIFLRALVPATGLTFGSLRGGWRFGKSDCGMGCGQAGTVAS